MRVLVLLAFALALSGCTGASDDDAGDGAPDDPGTPAPQNRTMPAVLHFEFGETAGCAGDAHSTVPAVPLNCVSYQGGPDATGIDGHWLALDETYVGLTLSTTMDVPAGANADSDCVFLDADQVEIGNANNGAEACGGVVPVGTAWLFLYPWGTPATGMTADFTA